MKQWEKDSNREAKIFKLETHEVSDEDLIWMLERAYAGSVIPPCSICGGKLSIQSVGGGRATVYACSPLEDDPDNPNVLRFKEGRERLDEHYSLSRHEDRRQGGDYRVMELIRRFKDK